MSSIPQIQSPPAITLTSSVGTYYKCWTDGTNFYRHNIATGNTQEGGAFATIAAAVEPILPATVEFVGSINNPVGTWIVTNGNLSTTALAAKSFIIGNGAVTITPPAVTSQNIVLVSPLILKDVIINDQNAFDINATTGANGGTGSLVILYVNTCGQTRGTTVPNRDIFRYGDVLYIVSSKTAAGGGQNRALVAIGGDPASAGDVTYFSARGVAGQPAARFANGDGTNANASKSIIHSPNVGATGVFASMIPISNAGGALMFSMANTANNKTMVGLGEGSANSRGVIRLYDVTLAATEFMYSDNAAWVFSASNPT